MSDETPTVQHVLDRVAQAIQTTRRWPQSPALTHVAQDYLDAVAVKPPHAHAPIGVDALAAIQVHLDELDSHAARGDLARVLHNSYKLVAGLPGHTHWHPSLPAPPALSRTPSASLAGRPKWRPGREPVG